MKKKTVALLLALVLVFGVAAGGTLAWLTAQTSEVKNTFTYGDINIDLYEHKYDADKNLLDATKEVRDATTNNNYIIIPGVNLPKDPKVTVTAGSEKCWLFVKVEETGTFVKDKVTYELNFDGWNTGDDDNIPANVYYKMVDASENEFSLNLLKGNQIAVSDELTKADLAKIEDGKNAPTLTFQAYAVQYTKFEEDPAGAWAKVNP